MLLLLVVNKNTDILWNFYSFFLMECIPIHVYVLVFYSKEPLGSNTRIGKSFETHIRTFPRNLCIIDVLLFLETYFLSPLKAKI